MKQKYVPGCKVCGSELEEECDGFLLGFLWCPKCKEVTTDVIAIPIKKNNKVLDIMTKVAV